MTLRISPVLSRRLLLVAGIATATAAAAGVGSKRKVPERSVAAQVAEVMERHFGQAVAASLPALQFAADLAARLPATLAGPDVAAGDPMLEQQVVAGFLHSTTYLSHVSRGEDLFYFGFYDPYERPCSSQLAAPV